MKCEGFTDMDKIGGRGGGFHKKHDWKSEAERSMQHFVLMASASAGVEP